jgi:hypothetical protein
MEGDHPNASLTFRQPTCDPFRRAVGDPRTRPARRLSDCPDRSGQTELTGKSKFSRSARMALRDPSKFGGTPPQLRPRTAVDVRYQWKTIVGSAYWLRGRFCVCWDRVRVIPERTRIDPRQVRLCLHIGRRRPPTVNHLPHRKPTDPSCPAANRCEVAAHRDSAEHLPRHAAYVRQVYESSGRRR